MGTEEQPGKPPADIPAKIVQIQLAFQPSHMSAPLLLGLDDAGDVYSWDFSTGNWQSL